MLRQEMLESEAYASLDLTARNLLWELRSLFKGDNNGSLYLSARDATARLGLSDCRPVKRAFEDLQDRGFIELAKDAHFAVKTSEASRARCWRLTEESWPECLVKARRGPTNDWRNYRAPGGTKESKRANRRLKALAEYRKGKAAGRFPVVDSTTTEVQMTAERLRSVGNSTTRKAANDANLAFGVVGESTTHIDDTRREGARWLLISKAASQILSRYVYLTYLAQDDAHLIKAA